MASLAKGLHWHRLAQALQAGYSASDHARDWGSDSGMKSMQDRAHRNCFITNTLADGVATNIL